MKLVITTQYKENYGDAEKPHWKFKGGATYVVENLTLEQAVRGRDSHPKLSQLIESQNSMSEEYIVGASIMQDQDSVCEPWEQVQVLSYEQGQWVARQTLINNEYGYMHPEIARADKRWVLLPQGQRKDFQVVYTLRDGRQARTDEEISQLLKAA
jgi:hypothetical protein